MLVETSLSLYTLIIQYTQMLFAQLTISLLIHSAGWTVELPDECECQAEMTEPFHPPIGERLHIVFSQLFLLVFPVLYSSLDFTWCNLVSSGSYARKYKICKLNRHLIPSSHTFQVTSEIGLCTWLPNNYNS